MGSKDKHAEGRLSDRPSQEEKEESHEENFDLAKPNKNPKTKTPYKKGVERVPYSHIPDPPIPSAEGHLERKPRRSRKVKINGKIASPNAQHNMLTHFPKDPNCPICRACKNTRAPCRS